MPANNKDDLQQLLDALLERLRHQLQSDSQGADPQAQLVAMLVAMQQQLEDLQQKKKDQAGPDQASGMLSTLNSLVDLVYQRMQSVGVGTNMPTASSDNNAGDNTGADADKQDCCDKVVTILVFMSQQLALIASRISTGSPGPGGPGGKQKQKDEDKSEKRFFDKLMDWWQNRDTQQTLQKFSFAFKQMIAPSGASSPQSVGGTMEGIGKLAMTAGIASGGTAAPLLILGGLTYAFGKAIGALDRWTESLHRSNMQFANVSASMAQVQAQHEIRTLQLNRAKGESRSESARRLAESRSRLDRTMMPIDNWLSNAKNNIGAFLNNTLEKVINALSGGSLRDAGDKAAGMKTVLDISALHHTMGMWTITGYGKPGRFLVGSAAIDPKDPRAKGP